MRVEKPHIPAGSRKQHGQGTVRSALAVASFEELYPRRGRSRELVSAAGPAKDDPAARTAQEVVGANA